MARLVAGVLPVGAANREDTTPRLTRILEVGDIGGLLRYFSLPSRRSPLPVERGAAAARAQNAATIAVLRLMVGEYQDLNSFANLSMKSYLAAAIQMTSVPDLEKNLVQAEELIDLAVRRGAQLVGLPENFSFLGEEEQKVAQAGEIARASEQFLKTMAQRFQITLMGGGFPVPVGENQVYNTALLIGSDGTELARYQKVHLFDVNLPDGNTYEESRTVKAGTQFPELYQSESLGNIGLSVCYDVRFPELYRHLSVKGANVFFVPAAFTSYTGKDHWQILLQARAIENTCYVIAPAQTGCHYGRRSSHGHATIVDPWGVVLADAGDKTGVAVAEIDPNRIEQVRAQMPSLKHRVFV